MEAVLWRFYIVSAFILLTQEIRGDIGGYIFFKFLCFQNPGHRVSDGDVCDTLPTSECDPYFTICIGINSIVSSSKVGLVKENCQTYYYQSHTYSNVESVCNTSPDTRGMLGNQIKRALAYPLPNTFYVKIVVRETDGWTSKEPLIASFSAQFKQIPASNLSNPIFKEISMYRNEFRYSNPKASLKIAMALQCERNLFGDHCLTACTETLFYYCSKEGSKICKEGWSGENCMVKDLCLYQLCAIGAKCIVIEKTAKCMCVDGTMGPHCYPNYDPCLSYVCENEGLCKPNSTGEDLVCKCFFPYYGEHCELKVNICNNYPCQNNGTCEIDIYGTQQCRCQDGFSGIFCGNSDVTTYNVTLPTSSSASIGDSKLVTILGILFGFSILCCAAIVLLHLCRKQKKKEFQVISKPLQAIHMKDLEGRLGAPKSVNNEYSLNNTAETIYETVDDYKTYSFLSNNNDDYLVPSRPTTPGFDTYGSQMSPVYLQMTANEDRVSNPPETNRDSFDLPPLPTRELHRKLSLKKFCLS